MSAVPHRFQDMQWASWQPTLDATLLFVVRDGQILLIDKKRGLGAGKINGPGGKVDGDETPLQGAVREVEEELRVTPVAVRKAGEVWFQVTDGTAIRIHVFRADDVRGEPVETDEARPLWTALDAIPFERMWSDDELWFPYLLSERPFVVKTLFEGDQLLGYAIDEVESTAL